MIELVEPAPRTLLNPGKLEDGIGLSLSGGGFRAMLFHLGAFYRLNEVGLLSRIDRVASVSGGSLAAASLALGWNSLKFSKEGVADNLTEAVSAPLLQLSKCNIDTRAILFGLIPGLSAAKLAAHAYDQQICHKKTLQDLPSSPRFVFIATSLQTGSIWRFSKEYAADYQVGEWRNPDIPLATVLSASAGFPPFLSPCRIDIPEGKITQLEGATQFREPFTRRLVLTDGGVYDNLGLEPVWKRYKTILVSDGGAVAGYRENPWTNWLSQSLRANNIALQQVIYLRRRFLRDTDARKDRNTVVWSIAEPVTKIHEELSRLTYEDAAIAANVPTRLKRLSQELRQLLLMSGYAHCERALRYSSLKVPNVAPNFANLPFVPV